VIISRNALVKRILLLLLGCFAATGWAAEVRNWTYLASKPFAAELVAADGVRATLSVPGRGKTVVPMAGLSGEDVRYIRQWLAQNRRAPLIDPEKIAPWPTEAVADNLEVKVTGEDAVASKYTYESAHFAVESDIKLPLPVVRDITAVFEATRAALMALPLGLMRGDEPGKYPVAMFSTAVAYQAAGGVEASGGFYDGVSRRMLIYLPNLGIKQGTFALAVDFQKQIYVLKHEVTHQLLGRLGGALPVWLNEGFSECIAAMPYTRGRYSFQNLDGSMSEYLRKWRAAPDRRDMLLVPPPRLMTFTSGQWREEVRAWTAFPLYNSSALLTHYFLRHDPPGDGSNLAAYFDDLRRGVPPEKAEADRLLRGRTREALTKEVEALARKLAIQVKVDAR
jgi:hypothetical protein